MAPHAHSVANGHVSAGVDAAFWTQDLSDSSTLALHFSPTASSTTQESSQGGTPPAQTPKSDTARNAPVNSSSNSNGQAAQAARTSVAVACVQCRSRHLKCDGGVQCSRCKTDGVECTYIKSRRGWKGKRKPKGGEGGPAAGSVPGSCPLTALWAPPGNAHSNLTAGQVDGSGPNLVSPIDTSLSHGAVHLRSPDYNYSPEYGLDVASLSRASSNFGLATTSPLSGQYNLDGTQRSSHDATNSPRDAFSAFYFYFYNSHPFCLPRQRLYELLKERRAPLLELAVQYIGSCYLPSVPTELYDRALEQSIQSHSYPKDGYSLQALLLFAIGLHANNKLPRAAQIFNIAIEMTLALGVNRPEFSLVNAAGDRVLEESWRRTWWSMYVANGMMAAVNPGVQFRLKDAALDVPLPCDDDQYLSGVSHRLPHIFP